ncbi:SDR family NAD(P)-dependent oxidoreductase [Nonomuraea aridisoli]|uniref:SDR family NAD(P)-dependent oxidoreductase n=1 Tax=Nonomuraea aridisoli TaxID=2070368 RepID=A0A2W2E247_9ACTN|nr:SDR family NAD(P)-dependent oxidoreductase [Nonomuraea aridisoli]PZG11325.1 hypothetical protein C1J01_34920 [Nonomuraea aridisoli]
MQIVVITGGTDGLGKGLALHYLQQGAHVIAIGSTAEKGQALLAEARALSAGRISFVRADLTSVAASRELVRRLAEDHPVVDKLILCAQRYRLLGDRVTTREGFEHSFALAYLSRFVLSYGLHDALRAARRPVVMNVGTPGVPLGRIHWDDLQLTQTYSGTRATLQSFRANDLLGVACGVLHAGSGISYIGYNPGVVSTGMPASLPQPLRAVTTAFFTLFAASVPRAIAPMTVLLDDPPAEPFTAHWQKRRLSLDGRAFDRHDALRLHDITRELISC